MGTLEPDEHGSLLAKATWIWRSRCGRSGRGIGGRTLVHNQPPSYRIELARTDPFDPGEFVNRLEWSIVPAIIDNRLSQGFADPFQLSPFHPRRAIHVESVAITG